MVNYEKYGKLLVILLFLVVLVPKVSQILTGSDISIGPLTLNDTVLLSISIFAILVTIFVFWPRPDLSIANKKFKKMYKPKSDLERIKEYIDERMKEGFSKHKIKYNLKKVGWPDDIINMAFETAGKIKPIKTKPKRKVKKSKSKKKRTRKKKKK